MPLKGSVGKHHCTDCGTSVSVRARRTHTGSAACRRVATSVDAVNTYLTVMVRDKGFRKERIPTLTVEYILNQQFATIEGDKLVITEAGRARLPRAS